MEKLIITAAICGMGGTKEDNPAIPYTIEEFVREAKAAYDAGAAVIHMHAREDDGTVSERSKRFLDCMDAITAVCPGVIIVQTGDWGSGNDRAIDCSEIAQRRTERYAPAGGNDTSIRHL